MEPLTAHQRKFLRGLAHALDAVVLVGQKGVTPPLLKAVAEALQQHELIKVRFVEQKEKTQKDAAVAAIAATARCHAVGRVGHVAIFFRPHDDPQQRRIRLPQPSPQS
jgi:RNA-binding protein